MLLARLLILAQAGGGGPPWMGVLFFAAMFGVMYLIMIRPQQKQLQAQKAMLSALVKGDEVITKAGIIGKIHAITDRVVTLEIANGVRVRILKDAIDRKYAPPAESGKAEDARESKEKDSKDSKDSKESRDSKEEK